MVYMYTYAPSYTIMYFCIPCCCICTVRLLARYLSTFSLLLLSSFNCLLLDTWHFSCTSSQRSLLLSCYWCFGLLSVFSSTLSFALNFMKSSVTSPDALDKMIHFSSEKQYLSSAHHNYEVRVCSDLLFSFYIVYSRSRKALQRKTSVIITWCLSYTSHM